MDVLSVLASQALTGSGQSSGIYLADPGQSIAVFLNITAWTGAGTIVFAPEWSYDKSMSTWFAPDTSEAFTSLGVAKKVVRVFPARAPFFRMSWTVTGIVNATTEIKAMMREGAA